MKKYLAKAFLMTSLASALLVGNFAFAQQSTQTSNSTQKTESKSKVNTASDQKITTNEEDPDLKLSIEELKKKYPISLLDKKKENYKLGQEINIDDYSISEIKAAFLNADNNFISRIPLREIPIVNGKYDAEMSSNDVKVHSQIELDIIDEACKKLGSDIIATPKKYQILQHFLFSKDKILVHAGRFVPTKTGTCFSISDPFELQDRN